MKKLVMMMVAVILTGLTPILKSVAGNGPKDPMSKDSWTLNFGIGPGIQYYSGYSAGFGPGVQVAFEKGMWELGPGVLTLGGEFGFSYFHDNLGSYYYNGTDYHPGYSWLTFIPAARSAYHYSWNVRGLDTYGGLSAGIRFLSFTATDIDYYNGEYNPAPVLPFFGIFLGTSYFFNDNIGINAELGYNITPIQIGMIFKLK